jgi:hypothetical protein
MSDKATGQVFIRAVGFRSIARCGRTQYSLGLDRSLEWFKATRTKGWYQQSCQKIEPFLRVS